MAESSVRWVFVGSDGIRALRGYLQFTLKRGIVFWWGALLLSPVFGPSHLHNAGENPIGILAAVAVGLMLCLSLGTPGRFGGRLVATQAGTGPSLTSTGRRTAA